MESRDAGSVAPTPDVPIAIIGAGFAGIGMGIQLLEAGYRSFAIFERAGQVGGTWRDNTYPGCACDVPSHVYSYSFELNPHWTRSFASSQEIQAYLLHCVEKYGLRRHLRLHTAITEAVFDEQAGLWTLTTDASRSGPGRWPPEWAGWSIRPTPTSRACRPSAARCSTRRAGTTTATSPARRWR